MTDTARLSFDEDLLTSEIDVSDDVITSSHIDDVTLASKQGYVFAQLLHKGVFIQERRIDYQAVCQFTEPSLEVLFFK